MKLQAGMPAKKGNKRGPAYTYNVKELRERETEVTQRAQRAYEHFVGRWQTGRRHRHGARAPQRRSDDSGCAAELASSSSALRHAVTRA